MKREEYILVYVCLADGLEEIEALTPVDYLRRAQIKVQTVGITGAKITGAHGISIIPDILSKQANTENLEMIVLPGGLSGTKNLENSAFVIDLLKYAVQAQIFIGAICAAPSILGKLGYLQQKEATCYPGFEKALRGAVLSKENVVQDGKIITAKSAGFSQAFSLRLIQALKGEEAAVNVAEQLCLSL